MFTGIVEELGEVAAIAIDGAGGGSASATGGSARAGQESGPAQSARLTVRGPTVSADAAHGDSICVSGICLTVVDSDADTFTAELMAETLARTSAGGWGVGDRVNLERSVTPATRLGGHIVQGHIDGVGTVVSRVTNAGYDDVAIRVPAALGRFIAPKGAIAVDGISLTVIDVTDQEAEGPDMTDMTTFTLGIIPETRRATTMGVVNVGDVVNVEVDVMAKYAERLLASRKAAQ